MDTDKRKNLYKYWEDLINISPRFMGTEAEKITTKYLKDQLYVQNVKLKSDVFYFNSWELLDPVKLKMISPVELNLEASALLGSGSTGDSEISGKVVFIGETVIWNMYEWIRFGILNESNEIIGYISARPDGEAISQTLSDKVSDLPHFVIGKQDADIIVNYLDNNQEISIKGVLKVASGERKQGENLRAIIPSNGPNQYQEKVIICAHYDTMFNTLGAYDNSSGSAILLNLIDVLDEFNTLKNVEIVFMGAEEWRLAGSRSYVNKIKKEEIKNISMVINIDGIGRGTKLEAWVGPEKLEREIFSFFNNYLNRKISIKSPPPPGSDHTPFYEVDIPVCMFTINDQEIIHSEKDILQEDIYSNMQNFIKVLTDFLIYKNVISK